MERKFRITEVKEITTQDGKKFNAYKTIAKNGKKMDVRFTRDVKNTPTQPCMIVCNEEDANVDVSRQYPILWIKNIIRTEDYEKKSNLSDYFDEEI